MKFSPNVIEHFAKMNQYKINLSSQVSLSKTYFATRIFPL